MDVDDVGSHAEAAASDADGGFASRLDASNVGGAGHEQATSGTDVSSPRTLAAGMHDNIQTLVPYGDSEEEVDLPDDCGPGQVGLGEWGERSFSASGPDPSSRLYQPILPSVPRRD